MVLNNLSAHHDVKRLFAQVGEYLVVGRQHLEAALGVGLSGDFYTLLAEVYAHDSAAAFEKFAVHTWLTILFY